MRIDLPINFINKISATARKPFQIAVFVFDFGHIYISDRSYEYSPGLFTLPLVEEWGTITTAGEGQEGTAETRQLTITLWNGGKSPFSAHFYRQDPQNVFVYLWQMTTDISWNDRALIDVFVIQEPIVFDEKSRLLAMDLVSLNMRYTGVIGNLLTLQNWPKALPEDVNKGIDLILGNAGEVKCLCAKTPLICTMLGSILKNPTFILVYEDLDKLNFPANGRIVIGEEIIFYNYRFSNGFNAYTRGDMTTIAVEHSSGEKIREYITDHTYLIGQGPISSVSNVKVGGLPVSPGSYSLSLNTDPAKIIFPKQPTYINYAAATRNIDILLNTIAANNTAFQPQFSFDSNAKSSGAIVSKDYPRLSVNKNNLSEDLGNIVKAFVYVEHWATKAYLYDRVDVSISGLGTIGSLSKPSAADITTVSGEVDIDHGHEHEIGGIHDHSFDNPPIVTADPQHVHTANVAGDTIVDSSNTGLPIKLGVYSQQALKTFFYDSQTNILSQKLHVRFQHSGTGKIGLYTNRQGSGTPMIEWSATSKTVDQWINLSYGISEITFVVAAANVMGGYADIFEISLHTTKRGAINYAPTAVESYLTAPGVVIQKASDTYGKAIKALEDVDPLTAANRQLLNIATTSGSKTIIEKFDITQFLQSIDWGWLVGRNIEISYIGNFENANVIITQTNFEIEYRPREILTTNEITCEAVGSLHYRPDKIIEYLLTSVAKIPISFLGSIWATIEVWNDFNIWDDTDIWKDSGDQLSYVEDTPFLEAGAKFSYLGYSLEGVISAGTTVSEALKNICRQTRSRIIWSGGMIKLGIREKSINWIPVKDLTKAEIRLKSISVEREKIENVFNDIDLFYAINRLSQDENEAVYTKSLNVKDEISIAKHGQRKNNSKWLFDLVRSPTMASSLADYYLWRFGQPATYYNFETYLQQFEIEKEDTIRLVTDFSEIIDMQLRVIDISRVFGSAKTGQINLLNFICESVRHLRIYLELFDSVSIIDSMQLTTQENSLFTNELTFVADETFITDILNPVEELMVEEIIEITAIFNQSFNSNVNVSDSLQISFTKVLEDSFFVEEFFYIDSVSGFGVGAFGISPFGSPLQLIEGTIDHVGISDELIISLLQNIIINDDSNISDETTIFLFIGVTDWTNYTNVTYQFETLISSGSNLTSAINTSGSGYARTNVLNLTLSKRYLININLTLNSGVNPILSIGTLTYSTGTGFFSAAIVPGENFYEYDYIISGRNVLWVYVTGASNFSLTVTVQEDTIPFNFITSWIPHTVAGTIFETFNFSRSNIISAINIETNGYAKTNKLNMVLGKTYRLFVNTTLNSGDFPILRIATINNAFTTDFPDTITIEGENVYEFKHTLADSDYLWIYVTTPSDFSMILILNELL